MSDELRRTYPIFSAKLLNRPHPKSSKSIKQYLVISGGGGKAASGIHNKLELFDISGSRVPKQICDVFTDDCGKGFPEDKNDIKRNNAPMNMSIYWGKIFSAKKIVLATKKKRKEIVSSKKKLGKGKISPFPITTNS